MREVRVVPPDPDWVDAFRREAAQIANALGIQVHALHHIGSTAIHGIYAKPIIDILLLVEDQDALDQRTSAMEALGYETMGEYGIPGRRYFRKLTEMGVHTHHVHAFLAGSKDAVRHLAFRDYMNAHADVSRAYSDLKLQLSRMHPYDMNAYMDGKDPFIKEHEALALAWWNNKGMT